MRVRVWGHVYRVLLTGRTLRAPSGAVCACLIRHKRHRILLSVLIPRSKRAAVLANAVSYASERLIRAAPVVSDVS